MYSPDRRTFLGAAASAVAYGCSNQTATSAELGLADLAAKKGILFGTFVRPNWLREDRPYAEMVKRECRLVHAALMNNWNQTKPGESNPGFEQGEWLLKWAGENNCQTRGGSLIYYNYIPKWFAELPSRAAAEQALHDWIVLVCRHFAGRVHSWNVVNEVMDTVHNPVLGLRSGILLDKIGPHYLDIAFQAAKEGDPKQILTFCDYAFEYHVESNLTRRVAFLRMVDEFQKRGTPIDALGIHGHLRTDWNKKFNEQSFAEFLKQVSDRGLKIMITELDVVDVGSPADIAARDADVAGAYKRFLDVALDNKSVTTLLTWGLTDKDSWIVSGYRKEFLRKDGLRARPLPFDTAYRPKPAYSAIAAALEAAPAR